MRAKTAHIFLALSAAPLAGAQDARFFSDPVGYVNALEQEVKMLRASHFPHNPASAAAAKPCPACPACPVAEPSPVAAIDGALDAAGEPTDSHDLAMELQVCTAQLQQSERRAQAAIQAQDELKSDANTADSQVSSLQSANEALSEKLRMAESGEHTQEAEQDWEQERALEAQWKAAVEKLQAMNEADSVQMELLRSQQKDSATVQERIENETRTLNASLQVTNHLNAQLEQLLRACANHEGMLEQQVAASKPAINQLAARAETAETMVQKLQFANVALEDETAQSQSALADEQAAIKSMRAQSNAEIARVNSSIASVETEDAMLRKQLQAARAEVKRLQARISAAEASAQDAKASAVAEAKSAEHARSDEADAVRRLTQMRKTANDFASRYKGAEARSEERAIEAEKKVENFKEKLKEEETLLNSAERKARLANQREAEAEAAAKAKAAEPRPSDAPSSSSSPPPSPSVSQPKSASSGFGVDKAAATSSGDASARSTPAPAAADGPPVSAKKARSSAPAPAPRKVTVKPRPASLLARKQPPADSAVVESESDSDDDGFGEVDDLVDMDP